MAPPARLTQNASAAENPPSNNLWIGNLSPDISESDLRALFEKHGKIDSVTSYSSRNYAFLYFKEIEGAKSAKEALQGYILRGNPLKIEFAKPAKPCKSLWVAGIGQSVSKENLEREFLKFGKIQEFRFLRDRNTAYVDYVRLEDAIQALKSMNGKRIGVDQIRVDFLRSQSSRREPGPDSREGHFLARNMGPSDLRWMAPGPLKNYPEPGLIGSKRHHHLLSIGSQQGGPQPSNVLLINYPPSVIIEEDMLHNAMILFGEIERIKTFPDRNYAFVEFRSIEEAMRAKEGLQGKLFNDPRIFIEYSIDEFPGAKGHVGDVPFRPPQVDILGLQRPGLPGSIPGRQPGLGMHAPDSYIKPPLGPHGTFEPAVPGPEFSDLSGVHKLPHSSPQGLIGGPNWRRTSPTPGMVSSPSEGLNLPKRSVSGGWDVFDASQLQRESKRSRFDAAMPLERTGNRDGADEPYGSSGGASGSLARVTSGGLGRRQTESDFIWRGVIAKGGTLVCHARCVPIGEGIGSDIPEVVNCSARTGLDLLSQHYEDAIGFSIVFFLPDSEQDFASYTEFLRYLGSRNRAGVAKFDDGTTLFLVPPSDFLTTVLKVSGPERLYGVVLKFPQVVASSASSTNPVPPHPQYAETPQLTSLPRGHNAMPGEDGIFPTENPRALHVESKLPPNIPAPVTSFFPTNPVLPTAAASQAGVALTPELIATLTSLLPMNNTSSASQAASLPQAPPMLGLSASGAPVSNNNMAHWKQDHKALNHNPQSVQQLSSQINPHLQQGGHMQAPMASNPPSHFHQMSNAYNQLHENPINLPHQGAVSSKPVASAVPLQSGPVTMMPPINQQYQQGNSQDMLRGAGMDQRPDAFRLYSSAMVQQPAYPSVLSNQVHGNGVSQPQPYVPQPSEVEVTHRSQPPQTSPYGMAQESGEVESDKNERYKTTLLFAANLLSRIHQQPSNQPGQGADH